MSGSLSVHDFQLPSLFILSLICIAALGTVLGTTFFMKAFQVAPIKYVAPTQYTQLIWGIIFGYLLFSDITSLNTLLGAAIIIIATIINLYYSSKSS